MLFRKQCWQLVSEWALGLMNALKYHWCEIRLSQSMWYLKILSSRSLCKVLVLYPAKNEEMYGIVPYQNFSWHSYYVTFKKNFNMWVTSGSYVVHIRIILWVKWVNRCDPLSTLTRNTFILLASLLRNKSGPSEIHACEWHWAVATADVSDCIKELLIHSDRAAITYDIN